MISETPVHFSHILTPLGPMLAAARDAALCLLEFTDEQMLEPQLKRLGRTLGSSWVPSSNAALDQTQHELDEYFAGRLRSFAVPLAPAGTDFQRRVWDVLTKIPYGTTRSYGEQARIINQPTA